MNAKFSKFLSAVGSVFVVIAFGILTWLYLVLAPGQRSAECDLLSEAFESMNNRQ